MCVCVCVCHILFGLRIKKKLFIHIVCEVQFYHILRNYCKWRDHTYYGMGAQRGISLNINWQYNIE